MHFKAVNNCFFPEYTFFDRELMTNEEGIKYITVLTWAFLGIISVALNSTLLIFIAINKKYHKSSTNLLILWCFAFNLLNTVLNFPVMIWGELNADKTLSCFSRVTCLSVLYLSIHGSATVLALVSIDRYWQMKKKTISVDINTRLRQAKSRFIYYSIFIWIITLSGTILRIVEPETRVLPCLVGVAIVMVTLFYLLIIKMMKTETTGTTSGRTGTQKYVHNVIIWLLVTFVATWLPSMIFGSLRHTMLDQSSELRRVILWGTKTVALGVVIDPMVYLKTYKSVRLHLKRRVKCLMSSIINRDDPGTR